MTMTDEDFDRFWEAYPRKVGKKVARTEFYKAIRETDIETMLAALENYKAHKPAYQDFCHPRTWLSQGRWDDEYEAPEPARNDHSLNAATHRWFNRSKDNGRRSESSHRNNVAVLPAAARNQF